MIGSAIITDFKTGNIKTLPNNSATLVTNHTIPVTMNHLITSAQKILKTKFIDKSTCKRIYFRSTRIC